jgi:serine/threonine protein kinase
MLCGYPPFYGECGRGNCGWNEGEHCGDCQESLFQRIQCGQYDFPDADWARVSNNARDLIRKLLVKDAKQRYTAADVLAHPWLNEEAPKTPLQTPDVLLRNDSARDLQQMKQNFNIDHYGNTNMPTTPFRSASGLSRGNVSLSRMALRNSSQNKSTSPSCLPSSMMPGRSTPLSGRGSDDGVFVNS